ncbi:hypothetical protein RRG08_010573 [Elysia crispata]|uniref:Uncharacterized protein n=1 Tax=Elysia crispata TaxID=231223 RepID=A0AAE0ZTX8_9GAST|nr:hypothetical protein RRG08_010573 [Elysia crispata]
MSYQTRQIWRGCYKSDNFHAHYAVHSNQSHDVRGYYIMRLDEDQESKINSITGRQVGRNTVPVALTKVYLLLLSTVNGILEDENHAAAKRCKCECIEVTQVMVLMTVILTVVQQAFQLGRGRVTSDQNLLKPRIRELSRFGQLVRSMK